jgi:hypothetical protein
MEVSGQLHAPTALPPGKNPNTHWIGDWVSPRAGLETMVKIKIPSPRQDSNPPIIQPGVFKEGVLVITFAPEREDMRLDKIAS